MYIMKKTVVISAAALALIFTTACGSSKKVLDCSMSQDSTGMKMTQNIKATFKKNDVKTINMTINVELEDAYLDYTDTIISSVESGLENYKDKNGITIKSEKNDNGFVVKFDADLSKMDSDTKKDLDMVDTSADYDASKKELEDEGYTCK